MAVLVTLFGVVLALLAVLVAGLLRSHAEILRALHNLGVDLDPHRADDGVSSNVTAREARVDRDLLAAGIKPGDPSRYRRPADEPPDASGES